MICIVMHITVILSLSKIIILQFCIYIILYCTIIYLQPNKELYTN